ncbi:hypothetical protein CANARDRAFT_26742 [[Candida] arabinofermentans NRRL YB-2248]|uniref:rRNA-processing protein FYV7 n=1 Tax=[Candida] arabinofermentans NRRL YB-2248 TaxID=983967 RepID=A0A1E4T6E3_9ASCO|nr:hypothetical protein CANARDRAFT_26742 [[Candida] arabinofermentans NRRL YB-2248]
MAYEKGQSGDRKSKSFGGKPKGGSFDKRKKPFEYRKPFNPRMRVDKKYGREGKTDEIKKALTHRASLRKGYFKLLEKEGNPIEKKPIENPNMIPIRKDIGQTDDVSTTEKSTTYKKPERKPLTFQERMQIKKERKERIRLEAIEKTKAKIQEMKSNSIRRERQTRTLKDAKTRSGQPLMGPRINNLLDKIKLEVSNN